jgi:acylphosphatase
MSRLMFSEMLDTLERFSAFFAAILVGRHGSPPVSIHGFSMARRETNSTLQWARVDAILGTGPGGPCMVSDDSALETRLIRVRGQVQGIGYREACVQRAREMGVTGWVRNQMDGSVEVLVQGSPKQLADMCAWLREGMPAALVDEFEVTGLPPPFARFDTFDRLPTL